MEFTLTELFDTTPMELYKAWLDSSRHMEMTGGVADISDRVGERFTAWDGYIEGKNLELVPGKMIKQSWRTVQFDKDQEDSIVEIHLEKENGRTRLTLNHKNLKDKDLHYKQGWIDNYFQPMKEYFG